MTIPDTDAPRTPHGAELHRPGSAGFRRLNAAMILAGLAAFGMLYATQPLLPALGDAFDVGATTASLSISVTTGALALLVIPVTAAGRRLGRVRTMRIALLVAVALTLVTALAPTYAVLLALRALLGASLAAVVAVAMTHVAAEVHPEGLGTAMGLYIAGNTLGGVGGRLLTAGVVDLTSWRWAVAALGGFALLVTLAFLWLLPPSVAGDRPHARAEAPTVAPHAPHALRDLLADPRFLGVLAVPFVLMGGFVATYNYLSYRLTEAPFELSEAVVGLVFLAYLAGTAASTVAGRAVDRVGRPRVLVVGIAVMAAGVAITVVDWLPGVVVGLLVLTGGFFAAHSTASSWAPVVGHRHRAQASALYVLAYYAGSSVFGALIGLGWSAGGWPAVAGSVGVLVALGLGAALALSRAVGSARP